MNDADKLNGKLIIALGRNYRYAHRDSAVLFRENGITIPQFTVLELLYNRGEQIIDKVLSSSGNITVVVRNLEQMKLVNRRKNPDDQRSYLISITKRGETMMDKVFAGHMANLAKAFSALSEEDKRTVVRILKKLR